jgi:hypothetical protein
MPELIVLAEMTQVRFTPVVVACYGEQKLVELPACGACGTAPSDPARSR